MGKEGEHEAVRDLAKFQKAVPHIWKYRDIRPLLVKAGELIPMEESERRSLIMCNPALDGLIATTTTMFAAYRINNPDEIAHRLVLALLAHRPELVKAEFLRFSCNAAISASQLPGRFPG